MEYSENDLLLRVIEPLYDVAWAYHMSSTVDHVAKRMERRRKTFSSTASVVSVATLATTGSGSSSRPSLSNLSVQDKVVEMEHLLRQVSRVMRARQFEDVCRVSLKSSDDLYPGFRDVLFIAQYLLEQGDAYKDLLTSEEINGLTLTQVFQYIFYEFCSFLLSGKRGGKEAIKLIITPTKITHAAYELCRQKFARLVADETSIVQEGLLRLVRRVRKDREIDAEVASLPPPVWSPIPIPVPPPPCSTPNPNDNDNEQVQGPSPHPPTATPTLPANDDNESACAAATSISQNDNAESAASPALPPSRTQEPEYVPQTPSPKPKNLTSPPRTPRKSKASRAEASVASRVTFPIIEIDDSDDSDDDSEDDSEDSVSSLESS